MEAVAVVTVAAETEAAEAVGKTRLTDMRKGAGASAPAPFFIDTIMFSGPR